MNQKMTVLILIIITTSLLSTNVVSAPVIKEKKKYYSVVGSSVGEIRNDLNRKRPNNYYAYTRWYVNWNFKWIWSIGKCRIKEVKTKVEAQYTLPQLSTSRYTPNSLIQKWNRYSAALTHHTNGHKNLGVNAAIEIENKIGSMAARKTCKQLKIDANLPG